MPSQEAWPNPVAPEPGALEGKHPVNPPDAGAEYEPKPYIPEMPLEQFDSTVVPETRQEIVKILTEEGWERGKDWFQEGITKTPEAYPSTWQERSYVAGFLGGAAAMHDFDPARFNREARLGGEDWQQYRDRAIKDGRQIEYAAALKRMDPERYEKEPILRLIPKEKFDDAFLHLSVSNAANSNEGYDLTPVFALKTLDPERFEKYRQSGRFREQDWLRVKETLDWMEEHRTLDMPDTRTVELIALRGQLQAIKPDGEPDFTMSGAEFKVLQHELWRAQDHGHAPRFFWLANAASRLRIVG